MIAGFLTTGVPLEAAMAQSDIGGSAGGATVRASRRDGAAVAAVAYAGNGRLLVRFR